MKNLKSFLTKLSTSLKKTSILLFASTRACQCSGLIAVLVILLITACQNSTYVNINFNDLSTVTYSGTPVNIGDSFTVGNILKEQNSGVQFVVLPYKWNSSNSDIGCPPGWTESGFVEIAQDNMSGGTEIELHFNNACLGILAPSSKDVKDLKLKFGDHGGNVNLIVAGTLYNPENFNSITLAGLTVSPGLPNGILELPGPLSTFYYTYPCPAMFPNYEYTAVVGGGQELWIDDIEFTILN